MIIAFFIMIYIYGLLPLLIGATALLMQHRFLLKSPLCFATMYGIGYVIYFALFSLLIAWETYMQRSYLQLVNDWKPIILVISVLSLTCIIASNVFLLKRNIATLRLCLKWSWLDLFSIGFTVCLIILAIVFLVPHAQDETPELARATLSNKSFFVPLPDYIDAENAICLGYLHLFYCFGSTITGISVVTLIHLFMPIFMIPLFVSCHIVISKLIFPGKKHQRERFRLVWLIILFYLLMLPFKAHIAVTPLRNIWNGISFASSCLFPLLFTICLDLIRQFVRMGSLITKASLISLPVEIVLLISLCFAIKLCVPFGFILYGLHLITAFIITAPLLIKRSITHPSKKGDEHL